MLFTPNHILEKDWINFHKELMPCREFDTNGYLGNEVEELECDICLEELVSAINKLKNHKAPGPDNISNELLTNLPDAGIEMVLTLLNKIMHKESMPLEWAESVTCMIFKKGDETNPSNYRPIALLNTMLKLFTQILYTRLVKWAETNKLLPEAQGGFRSGRSCEDQILCLQTAIHAKLRQKRGKLYALFVDFERCFNTLPHSKMWSKLFSLGMSGKIIRILKSLYENATTRVRMEHGLTQPIDITEGVMQGEILSPFLYSLYVSEMEKLLINSNIPGVKIAHDFFLHLLCYADDTVVLACTPINLQHKINILKEYFEELGLKVNLRKTKVMVFRRGGRLQSGLDFRYGNGQVDIVSEYTYLGVPFSSSGVYVKAAKYFKQKGLAALGSVWKVIMGGKASSWWAKYTLFRSISASSTMYASHLWGLRYLEVIEDVQQHFYKKLLGVSKLVPRYIVRLECGVPPMNLHVIKQCLLYMLKVNNMEECRYTKKCFTALHSEVLSGEYGPLNWVGQVSKLLEELGYGTFIHSLDASIIPAILERVIESSRQEDISKVNDSTRFSYYNAFIKETLGPAPYLEFNMTFKKLTLIAQARLNLTWRK